MAVVGAGEREEKKMRNNLFWAAARLIWQRGLG